MRISKKNLTKIYTLLVLTSALPIATFAKSGGGTITGMASNSVIGLIGLGSSPRQLAIAPNGSRPYVAAQIVNQITVIEIACVTDDIHVPNAVMSSPGGNVSMIDTNSKTVIGNSPAAGGPRQENCAL